MTGERVLGEPVDTGRTGRLLPYEASLDGLRGVAIAGVVAYHACAQSGLPGWFRGGFIGVSVFFTLSGFLITTLLLREHDAHGRIDIGRFVSRRIRRLSPALLVTALAVAVLSGFGVLAARASDVSAAAWSFTNWHVIAGGESQLLRTIVGPLGPTWSLGVEEQLYAVLLVAALWAVRRRDPGQAMLAVGLVASAASVLLALTVSDWNPRLEFGTDARAADVAVGVVLAALLHRGRLPQLGPARGDALAIVALAAVVSGFFWIDLTPPWLLHGGYALLACVSAVAIVALLQHGRAATFLSRRPLVALGNISYSLYLVHWPVMSILTRGRIGSDGAPLVALQLAVSVLVAIALHIAVEQPVRRMPPTAALPTLAAHVAAALAVTVTAVVVLA